MVSGIYDNRRHTQFWPLIATLEGELKDTPWWRIFKKMDLVSKLQEAKSAAFSAGLSMALEDLEKAGMIKKV